MNEPEHKNDQPDTADLYHFRNRKDLILFCLFILAALAAITWWLMRGAAPA